ncbi:MAG: hypothetical protein VB071_01940 [Lawsonibacter sp.]|nr:hypothetical protein [Lawsonibacter sp.]
MNAITLYEIYDTTHKYNAPDLIFGLAMYKAEHPDVVSHVEDKAIREFMGKYGPNLAAAFPDREMFAAAVADGIAEEARTAEQVKA